MAVQVPLRGTQVATTASFTTGEWLGLAIGSAGYGWEHLAHGFQGGDHSGWQICGIHFSSIGLLAQTYNVLCWSR